LNISEQFTNRKSALLLVFVLFLFTIGVASAQLDLPPGIEAIKDYNQQYAMEFLQTITIPLVFLAGILSIVSPCILPLIPAFFSYTFKEKKNITKMTLVFFFGFSAIFIIMGISAAYLGQSLVVLQSNMTYMVALAGLGLIGFGLLAFFGKGFSSFIRFSRKSKNDKAGIFLMGVFFAVGWSACLGPIIGGILLIAAIIGNVTYAATLLFVYSLGIMTPLLIMSLLFDRFNLGNNKWIKGKEINFNMLGKRIITHTTEMISGTLLIGMGLIFILFGGTTIINTTSLYGSSILFNDLQRMLLDSPMIATGIGVIVFVLLAAGLVMILRRKRKS
jgi:cytochrome c-type biogenesis protein